VTYPLTFAEAATGITGADVTNQGSATGCVFSPSASSGTAIDVVITGCSEGTLIPRLLAGTVSDGAGNTGPATDADGGSITIDRTPTTATWTPPATPTNAAAAEFTLAFGDAISGLAASDITNTGTATGCTFGVSAATGTSVTVTAGNCSEGTVIPEIAAGAVTDSAGNASPASAQASAAITIDRTAPSVTAITPSATLVHTGSYTYAISFSEPITGLAAGDVTLSGTAGGRAAARGRTRSL